MRQVEKWWNRLVTEVIPENNRDYFPDNGMTAQKSLGLIFENLVPLVQAF